MRIALLLSFTCAWLVASPPCVAQTLGLGTMSPGTLSYSAGSAIGRVLHEHAGPRLRVQPHGGETVLMPLLEGGELDFAIASVVEAGDAYAGRGAFAGRPQTRLRIAAALFPLRVALFVRADSDIRAIADLAGRRVPAGFAAMASIERLLDAVLANGGLRTRDVQRVLVPNVVKGAEQFANGRADAFFFAVGAAKVREVAATRPLRMLPLDDSPAALARMREVFAEGYPSVVQPGAGMAGEGSAVALAFDNLLLTAEHVPEATVLAVLTGVAAHRAGLVAGFPPFRELRPQGMVKPSLPIPFHVGSLRWQTTR